MEVGVLGSSEELVLIACYLHVTWIDCNRKCCGMQHHHSKVPYVAIHCSMYKGRCKEVIPLEFMMS